MLSLIEKLKRISLTTKVVILVIIVGVVIGTFSDYTADKTMRKVLNEQLNSHLDQQSQEDRLRFEMYMNTFRQTVRLIVAQEKFQSYLDDQEWFIEGPVNTLAVKDSPNWFLSSGIQRALVTIKIAVLIDGNGIVQEVYSKPGIEIPLEIKNPDPLLIEKSRGQTHIAVIDESAYMVSSDSVRRNEQEVTLMMASPIDGSLLVESQRDFPNRLVALLTVDNTILASNNEQLLHPGEDIKRYQEQYVVTNRAFYDYGGSEMAITFTSFVPIVEREEIATIFSRSEKQHHILATILYTLSFALIILWVTGRIRKLTVKVDTFARKSLGAEYQKPIQGDKLIALEERFKKLTEEIETSQESIRTEAEQRTLNQLMLERKERQFSLLETVTEAMEVGVVICENGKVKPINKTMKRFESIFGELDDFKLEGIKRVERRVIDLKDTEHYFIIKGEILPDDTKVIFARDITERKRIIDEKEKLQNELVQAQKMEAIGRLAGGVAHDFNNILSAIIGYAQLSSLKLPEGNQELKEHLSLICESGEKAAALTGQLLAFSRKQVMKMIVLNPGELISNLAKMLMRLITENIQFDIHVKRTGNVWADPGQLEQVFINLAVNARDAMPDGGRLILEVSEESILRDGQKKFPEIEPGEYVMIIVSDTGTGIPPETIDYIFDPFFTTKEVGKGTGLGLSTVYGIIKQHKGYIYVDSMIGHGTSFTIFIPVYKGPVRTEKKNEITHELPTGNETVLVVEDDETLRKMISSILVPLGYKILEAENGEEALKVYQEFEGRLDLLLTDVIMPVMNGRELHAKLTESLPDIKTIFMSGYTDDVISKQGILEPGFVFINKPISPHKLATIIREQLDS